MCVENLFFVQMLNEDIYTTGKKDRNYFVSIFKSTFLKKYVALTYDYFSHVENSI